MAYDIEAIADTDPRAVRAMLVGERPGSAATSLRALSEVQPDAALELIGEALGGGRMSGAGRAAAASALRWIARPEAERIALDALVAEQGPITVLAGSIGWIGSREALPVLLDAARAMEGPSRHAVLNAARLVAYRTRLDALPAQLRTDSRMALPGELSQAEKHRVPGQIEKAAIPASVDLLPDRASAFAWRGDAMAAVPIAGAAPTELGSRIALITALLRPGEGCADRGVPYIRYFIAASPDAETGATLLAHDGRVILSGTFERQGGSALLELRAVEGATGPLAAARLEIDLDGRLRGLALHFDERRVRTTRPLGD